MENVETKFVVIEVEGEAVLKFPFHSVGNDRFEMMDAVLASNPVVRLVDNVEVGNTWNGTQYA
jgi:hypothetical protein